MTSPQPSEPHVPEETNFDKPEFKAEFEKALAEIEAETATRRKELRNSERLTAADFAVRINARD
jgi:hypothetical protein